MSQTKSNDIDKLLQFLHICILVFLNQGSSSFSDAFMEEPWSWGLILPISLYFKFALELHAHLGLCVGIGLPSLIYWALTRSPMDWYLDIVLDFNIDFLKTGLFNLITGLAHWLVLKLLHKFHKKVKENKKSLSHSWPKILSKFEESFDLLDHPMLRPVDGKEIFMELLEILSVFFYNGNVMLLCWGFSGNNYSSEVGRAISWVSLGSSLHVWMKACLKVLEVKAEAVEAAEADEKKVYQMEAKGEETFEQTKEQQLQVATL
ncbi:hypothetical protein G2W53_019128 [Senna tora]|uniref:Uncharacterized protein n=1 Tax=Senna tora TaxID=362788 RepID=A0A834TUD3_9FABA|nr:hypothetical protein G2W53_019128 [Senna tora]